MISAGGSPLKFFANAGGNTGRAGHRRSIASSRAVSLARELLADLLGAESPDNLVYTKNATEALNLAIYGLVADGARVVTTSLEHNSVMRPLRELERQGRKDSSTSSRPRRLIARTGRKAGIVRCGSGGNGGRESSPAIPDRR